MMGELLQAPAVGDRLELGERWACECGREHTLGGMYLAAHWLDELTHTCEACGRRRTFIAGEVIEVKIT